MMNNTMTQTLSDAQMVQFNELAHKLNKIGLNLLVFDPQFTCVLQSDAGTYSTSLNDVTAQIQQGDTSQSSSPVWIADNLLTCPIISGHTMIGHVVVDTGLSQEKKTEQEKP